MKRKAIVAVTFLAGLYYVLEFLLPPRIGGSPDWSGAAQPGVCRLNAWMPRTLCYTGLREGEPPLLMEAPLAPTPEMPGPRVLLAPSRLRRDDYRGCTAPCVVRDARLFYIGLGWDDKTPRVCMAERDMDGRWAPAPRAVLDRGKTGEWDSSGIDRVEVRDPYVKDRFWRMWTVGRQGEIGRLGYATSKTGEAWSKSPGPVYTAPPGWSVESVTVARWPEGFRGWMTLARTGGERKLVTAMLDPGTGAPMGPPIDVAWAEPWPAGLKLLDARAHLGLPADATRLFVTLQSSASPGNGPVARASVPESPGTAPYIAEAAMDLRRGLDAARLELRPKPLVAPGPAPRSTYLSDARTQVDDLLVVVGSFAIGLGLIGLGQLHGKRVAKLKRGWPESVAFFVAAGAMAAFTVYDRMHPDLQGTWGKRGYELLFTGLFQPLGAAMFSLLACYLVSAAYRAFKIRNLEGGLMAASAMLIMLGQVPVGNWLTQHLPHGMQIPTIMAWVLFVSNNAVVRAVNFGIFVGAMATALRIWLSMDRAVMRTVDG